MSVSTKGLPSIRAEVLDLQEETSYRGEFEAAREIASSVQISPAAESRLAIPGETSPVLIERFRILAQRLRRLRAGRDLSRILITSAVPQEGKTLVATNLAITLATPGTGVLLIDADLSRPTTARVLGIQPSAGVADVLKGTATIASALRFVEPCGFYYLGAGDARRGRQDADLASLLLGAGQAFDWVVIDCAPILFSSETHALTAHADGVLLVARALVTPRRTLAEAVQAVDAQNFLGVVLNGSDDPESKYDYYSGSKLAV